MTQVKMCFPSPPHVCVHTHTRALTLWEDGPRAILIVFKLQTVPPGLSGIPVAEQMTSALSQSWPKTSMTRDGFCIVNCVSLCEHPSPFPGSCFWVIVSPPRLLSLTWPWLSCAGSASGSLSLSAPAFLPSAPESPLGPDNSLLPAPLGSFCQMAQAPPAEWKPPPTQRSWTHVARTGRWLVPPLYVSRAHGGSRMGDAAAHG